jgi:hypothetical protein
MYSNLTSYWTIMMTNIGYYLYMLNKYETFIYWTKNSNKLVYPMENTVDRRLSLPWKEYENLQKLVTF